MEPFSPQDPLRKLLDQDREIEVRTNFTQNVMRLARQTPQNRGWLASLRAWWNETTLAHSLSLASSSLAALAVVFLMLQSSATFLQVADESAKRAQPALMVNEMPLLPEIEATWENPLHTEALFAVEDSSQFTDSEISLLLY